MTTLRLALEKCRFVPPGRVTDDTSVLTLKALVLEPLVRWDDGVLRPGLFARWTHDGRARQWRFHLREGARFHDGAACTADDIVAFIDDACGSLDMFGMRWAYARYLAGARITAEAPGCVAIETPAPFADLPEILTEFHPCRLAPDGQPLLGTGPWRVLAHAPERDAVLERVVPGAGPTRIAVTAVAAADDRLRLLREGGVDAATNLERCSVRQDGDTTLDWGCSLNTLSVMYYLNGFEGLFSSAAARRAVNHAVDSGAIIDGLFHGLGRRAATVVSPWHLGMRAALLAPIPHDPDLAKRLLEACDVPAEVTIRTPTHMPERAREISERVAADLAAIGLDCRIEVQPDRPEYAREVGRKRIGDMAIFDSTPHSTFRILNDKVSAAVRGTWWQGHADPALEAMIGEAGAAVHDAAREALYGRCLARLRDDPPWLYLFHPIEMFGCRKGLGGLALEAKGVLGIA